jgi:hypothetical protein
MPKRRLDLLAHDLLDEADKITWATADRADRLGLIAIAAGRLGDTTLWRWAQRERLGEPMAGCPSPIPLERSIPGGIEFQDVDCERRACPWCGPRMIARRADELWRGFLGVAGAEEGQRVEYRVLVVFCTAEEATSRIRTLSRKGFPAVPFAQPDGTTLLVAMTPEPAESARAALDRLPSTWTILPWEEMYGSLRTELYPLIERVPGGRRVRPNDLLRAAVDEGRQMRDEELATWKERKAQLATQHEEMRERRAETAEAGPWERSRHREARTVYAVQQRMVTDWHRNGSPHIVSFDPTAPEQEATLRILARAS